MRLMLEWRHIILYALTITTCQASHCADEPEREENVCRLESPAGLSSSSLMQLKHYDLGKSNGKVSASQPELTSIQYRGEADGQPVSNTALYTTLVRPSGEDHWKGNDMLLDTMFLYCSARWAGSKLPFHITTSGIQEAGMRLLKDLGFQVHDFTGMEDQVKAWYKPVYTKEEALSGGRLWVDPKSVPSYGVDGEHALKRKDGWATYFKFFVWNSTDLDLVLHTDVDVQFLSNPDPFLREAAEQGLVFMAAPETGGRQYIGLNTHMMLLRPSETTFKNLIVKASQGDYVPLTNTEQDVLEWYFDPAVATQQNIEDRVLHEHNSESKPIWMHWIDGEVPASCSSSTFMESYDEEGLTCKRLADACNIDFSRRHDSVPLPTLPPRACAPREVNKQGSRPRVFVLVPGFGDAARKEQLLSNIGWLRKQDVEVSCMIYVYQPVEKMPLNDAEFAPCSIQRQAGYPAQFMLWAPKKQWSNQDYVLVWFDDVALPQDASLTRMMNIMNFNGLGALAPSYSEEMYKHWPERHGKIMFHNSSEDFVVGRHTSYAELMFLLMTPASFNCLRGLVDEKSNPYGYGLDRLYPDRCSDHCLGVLDEITMMDMGQGTFKYDLAEKYQEAYFSKHGFPSNREIIFGPLQDPRSKE